MLPLAPGTSMTQPQENATPAPRTKVKIVQHTPGPLAKAARIRSDAARHAYVRVRRVLTEPWNRSRRSVAKTIVPGSFALDRHSGFVVQPAGALPGVDDVVTASQEALDAYLARPESVAAGRKAFLLNVLNREALIIGSPFMRLALQPDMLTAVTAYLQVVPILTTIQVFYSDVMKKAPQSSQLYHCDGDDVEQVKVFVLCSPVEPDGGPLTILPADDSERVREVTGYHYRQRLTDQQVDAAGVGQPTAVVGPAGTFVVVDTSRCFHFGSRVAKDARPRLVAMIQYQTPYSFMLPVNVNRVAPFRDLATADMPLLQRMVLGGA
jgi:hypothetical protein